MHASEIIPITNGVHAPTWQDHRIREADDAPTRLWDAHMALKRDLLNVVGERTGVALDPHVLTIGFARRAAPYKRSNLIFRDRERIDRLLSGGRLQLLFAGKAHPNDEAGREIVAELVHMAQRYPGSVVFVPDYDMALGRALTRGADVWLNNPIRPLEACGTSGMKAAMNGVLNCSVLDGWWPEACEHGRNGWAIGDGTTGLPEQDDRDAAAMYDVIENEVLPAYADRERWAAMMQASIASTRERFSSDRMLRDYFGTLYARG